LPSLPAVKKKKLLRLHLLLSWCPHLQKRLPLMLLPLLPPALLLLLPTRPLLLSMPPKTLLLLPERLLTPPRPPLPTLPRSNSSGFRQKAAFGRLFP
jgi:hypothetical protein